MMVRKILNVIFFIGVLVVNYLANALPINKLTTGELSDLYPNLFVPAGITFSIWGVIYLLLLLFTILQFIPKFESYAAKLQSLFIISCILNMSWIFVWHYRIVVFSVLIMLGFLYILIRINQRLKGAGLGVIHAAFGIYLGWLMIATIANITTLLVDWQWQGWGWSESNWTVLMIMVGAMIASISVRSFANPYISLAVIWAFIGIILKQKDAYQSIVIACLVGMAIVSAISLRWIVNHKLHPE